MVCITLLNKECFLGASGVDSINVIRDSSSEVTVPVKLIVSTICKESEESSVSVFFAIFNINSAYMYLLKRAGSSVICKL